MIDIRHGDLFAVLPTLAADSVEAVVTDPPYGIGFMGREWDTFRPGVEAARILPNRLEASDNPNLRGRKRAPASSPSAVEYDYTIRGLIEFQAWTARWAREVFRVMKPGAYLVVCGAPRSYHRMACGLEDAGFVIRDKLSWIFGSGFPKSLNLGDGKGTALKPGHEPIALAWKPFKGSITACHQTHGTAALNIEAARVGTESTRHIKAGGPNQFPREDDAWQPKTVTVGSDAGRWPATVVRDEDAAEELDDQSGHLSSGAAYTLNRGVTTGRGIGYGSGSIGHSVTGALYGDSGGASRFFYCAKPARSERDAGCDFLTARTAGEATDRADGSKGLNSPRAGAGRTGGARNIHPTVKPVSLMRWLIRLVAPPGGVVLDPFNGSGTTGMACAHEGRRYIGIEREAEYVAISIRRVASVAPLLTTGAGVLEAEELAPSRVEGQWPPWPVVPAAAPPPPALACRKCGRAAVQHPVVFVGDGSAPPRLECYDFAGPDEAAP